ncbi:MAG TPA: tetratricopeptide repeat protein [Gaiellaceae bacterium]|nr:tetratricopeptide repeat protein [Gaiellaceae bacterium]
MARAAAKRRPPVRHEQSRRRHKDSGGQRYEDTLFFNRIRKQAKWVFIFLAVVFAGGFVLFGVGSSNVSGLSDIFSGIRGGGGGPSVSKALKQTEKNPKNAQAWHDLATAYDSKGDLDNAVGAWQTYTQLRPRDVDGLTQLATDYAQQLAVQTQEAQAALAAVQSAQGTTFAPPSSTPLGRALGSIEDPVATAASSSAQQQYQQAFDARQATATTLADVYSKIAKLQPAEPSAQLQLAQAAQDAGETSTAIAAYKKFVELAPFDNQVPYAKQQIKALQAQVSGSSQG